MGSGRHREERIDATRAVLVDETVVFINLHGDNRNTGRAARDKMNGRSHSRSIRRIANGYRRITLI